MKKVLHADMQLSRQSNDCWSAHILSAMDGLTQSCIFKQKLQNCEPIDLSCFVLYLTERHLKYWTPYSALIRENATANTLLFLQKGLWSLIRLALFPNTCCSTCLVMSFAEQLVSDFVFTPYVLIETATWNQSNPPTCDLCDTDGVYDDHHVLFHCANLHVIPLLRKYASLFPQQEPTMCVCILSQARTITSFIFSSSSPFVSRLAVALLDRRHFL